MRHARLLVHLRGKIRFAHHGALMAVQRLRRGAWATIDGTVAVGRPVVLALFRALGVRRAATL